MFSAQNHYSNDRDFEACSEEKASGKNLKCQQSSANFCGKDIQLLPIEFEKSGTEKSLMLWNKCNPAQNNEFKENQADHSRNLAAFFAIAVTVDTSFGRGYIDRHGNATLFNALRRVLPQVCYPMKLLCKYWKYMVCLSHVLQ